MRPRKHVGEDARADPLSALRGGDPRPFEDFVTREAGTFVAFFVRLGASRAEAEDLAQDLFVKLFRHASRYEPRGRFDAFAFRVARNAWADRQRRRAVRRPAQGAAEGAPPPLEALPSAEPGPDGLASRSEEARLLRAAVRALPEAQQLVLELGLVQGLAYAEVAELLEIPVGTVKSRMFHALRRLRAALRMEGGEEQGEAREEPA
jgi:RNA polymerase sigma-70 factor (ECF subfamily)